MLNLCDMAISALTWRSIPGRIHGHLRQRSEFAAVQVLTRSGVNRADDYTNISCYSADLEQS